MTFAPFSRIRPRRSLLLTSPLKPDAFGQALRSGADIVCIDLEDAYCANRPGDGRTALKALSAERDPSLPCQLFTRINTPKSAEGVRDLCFILDNAVPVDGLMLPKLDNADEVRVVDQILSDAGLGDIELGVIIETAAGLENAPAIAAASPRITWIAFGGYDLSAALGVKMAWEPLLYARSRTSRAAALAGVQVLDCPTASNDPEILWREAIQARDLGYAGKVCRGSDQVAVVHSAFAASDQELARAERIVAAADKASSGTLVVDGKMIEPPTILAMRRRLTAAKARG